MISISSIRNLIEKTDPQKFSFLYIAPLLIVFSTQFNHEFSKFEMMLVDFSTLMVFTYPIYLALYVGRELKKVIKADIYNFLLIIFVVYSAFFLYNTVRSVLSFTNPPVIRKLVFNSVGRVPSLTFSDEIRISRTVKVFFTTNESGDLITFNVPKGYSDYLTKDLQPGKEYEVIVLPYTNQIYRIK